MIARWNQGRAEVDELLDEGRIERVEASRDLAIMMVEQARIHVETASQTAESDPAAAFQTAYDAARKSLAAILANQGLRATNVAGAHAVLLEVTLAQLDPPLGAVVRHFTWLRRTRNQSEYPTLESPGVTADDVRDALPLVSDIIDLAVQVIDTMPRY